MALHSVVMSCIIAAAGSNGGTAPPAKIEWRLREERRSLLSERLEGVLT
jgi:hypothetical protein